MVNAVTWVTFLTFFVIFAFLGFYGAYWRRGKLTTLHEWALAGRRLGTWLMFFLVGADLYTAYTFIAVPSSLFAKGAIYFFAVPYVAITFAIAMLAMPRIWTISREKGYITASDLIKDRFNSRTLAILVAITGIVAELPYIALQIVGMQAVLTAMLYHVVSNVTLVSEIALIVAFIVLAAFTWTSGLRGATLAAVFKDALIFLTVIAVIVVVASAGDIGKAFAAKPSFATLPSKFVNAYWSLFVMSALALYLYPHAINGIQGAQSAKSLRRSTALLPLYGVGLAGLALFGVLIYGVPSALAYVKTFPASTQGTQVVPGLIFYALPDWMVGIAFLGIFIGGLVPATIMAMSQANLLTRNLIKEVRPLTPEAETRIAKWASVIFKFLALGFVFAIPATYAIQLQLFGGVLILQILPALFFGLFQYRLNKYSLMVGLLSGIGLGLYLMEYANKFGPWSTTLYQQSPFGLLYIGLTALSINVIIVLVGSALAYAATSRTATKPTPTAPVGGAGGVG
jgi:SSS family solute:Na+ symporter